MIKKINYKKQKTFVWRSRGPTFQTPDKCFLLKDEKDEKDKCYVFFKLNDISLGPNDKITK